MSQANENGSYEIQLQKQNKNTYTSKIVLDKNVREPRVRPWPKKLSNMAITFYL
jgi:hypothetical protein